MSASRLSEATLSKASSETLLPGYDRDTVRIGAVHFGPGAFHRAHQAFYFDALLGMDPSWGISAVALRSPGVRDALAPQDGLYVLAALDRRTEFRVVGALRELLVAREQPEAVLARLAAPGVRVVTMTVTEKGYCLTGSGELDLNHPDIAHDLAHPDRPVSLVGWLVAGLQARKQAGAGGLTIISCDNLVDNGTRLAGAVRRLAAERDPELARWIKGEVRFPRTMVDSITPATDDALRTRVEAETGLADAWPIQREAFTQWVVEDVMRPDAPDLASVGVTLTDDVAAYDRAKLRLLNGAHSTLAYRGLLAGHATVADAMRDEPLARFVEAMMREDIAPTLQAPRGLDLGGYIDAVLGRFRNPEIRHNLSQIAWDGSQKLPFRIVGTVEDAQAAGRPLDRLVVPLAAWMQFVRRQARAGTVLVDPLADRLAALGGGCTGDASQDVARFLALDSVFPARLASNPDFRTALERSYAQLADL